MISIHAPRVGSDDIAEQCYNIAKLNFNPRSPCGERPSDTTVSGRQSSRFQSTLPVWGATHISFGYRQGGLISIHAPRVGSDAVGKQRLRLDRNFNPRSPCGERPAGGGAAAHKESISIHAPRVGSDVNWDNGQRIANRNFNPRSPCGERQAILTSLRAMVIFQSTLPVWGATKDKDNLVGAINISIHAPRVGSDANVIDCYYRRRNFNPRSPCGERL